MLKQYKIFALSIYILLILSFNSQISFGNKDIAPDDKLENSKINNWQFNKKASEIALESGICAWMHIFMCKIYQSL